MIENYLNSFVNKIENISDLLGLYLSKLSAEFGALFVQEGKTNKHTCIQCLDIGNTELSPISFEPVTVLEDIIFCNNGEIYDGIKTTYRIRNMMLIPIMVHKDRLGAVFLANCIQDFHEDMITEISPIIGLTQLILNKQKLIRDYKKIYSDSNNFSKDLFLANMSHEIRTPLNGVIGYNQLLMQTELTKTQQNYLSSMNQCSIQLLSIINDVIDFSKLASGNMTINNECFSLKEVTEAIQDALGQRIKDKRQTITYNIKNSVPKYIIIDKQKLIQIVVNLVSNACKFTDIGGFIEVSFDLKTDNFIFVSVKDNGIGISEQDQCKLFNAFMQIQDSLTKTGSGLGLAIASRLVELLHGEISVCSSLGNGSTFSFTAKFKPYHEFEKEIEKDKKLLKNKYVLVVDDNADNRILLTEILFEWEMNPIVCASALEALRMVLSERYNFVLALIDICMPIITGTELAKQLKEERPFLPLIALSSIDSFINATHFEKKLDKPINKVQLFDSIYKILSKNKQPSAYIGNESSSDDSEHLKSSNKYNKKVKILIAEDILYNRTLLYNMLNSIGYENIDTADDGVEAMNKINLAHENNEPHNILLLDLRMPKMDGYDLIEAIERKNYKLPKIIIVTASVLETDRTKCKSMDVKYFINKPIQIAQLKEVLLHVCNVSE